MSDQIRGTAGAVIANLFDVRLHETDYNALIGHDGWKLPADVDEHLAQSRLDMHLTGFFQAVGTTLDCLAAAAIGVLRVPKSLHRADFNDLAVLDPASKESTSCTPDQRESWTRLHSVIEKHRVRSPADWLEWSLEMRNALLHRPRGFTFFANRPRESKIEVVTASDEVPFWLLRFDPHLLKMPWLRDMTSLPTSATLNEVVIGETASSTLRGLVIALNELVEEAAGSLLHEWRRVTDGTLSLPSPEARRTKWERPIKFAGFTPASLSPTEIRVAPDDVARLRIVAALRSRLGLQ